MARPCRRSTARWPFAQATPRRCATAAPACARWPGPRSALRPGGLFAFSVEAHDGSDFSLNIHRRYAHSHPYLERLAAAHGLRLVSATPGVIRKERDEAFDGLLVVMRRA